MVDVSQFANVTGLAFLIGLIVQVLIKPRIADREALPFIAIVGGILLALLIGVGQNQIATLADALSYAVGGFLAALTAIGGYEASLDKLKR